MVLLIKNIYTEIICTQFLCHLSLSPIQLIMDKSCKTKIFSIWTNQVRMAPDLLRKVVYSSTRAKKLVILEPHTYGTT